MLCPNCGTEVGESVRLCIQCEADRQARLAEQRRSEEAEQAKSSSRWGRQSAETETSETDSSGERLTATTIDAEAEAELEARLEHGSSSRSWTIPLVVLFLLVLAGVKVYKERASLFGSVGSSPSISGTATPVPTSSPISKGYVSDVKAGLKFDRSEIKTPKAVAVYHRGTRKIDVLFFREWDRQLDDAILRKSDTPEFVQGVRPDAVLSLIFQPDFQSCSLASLAEYSMTVYRNSGGIQIPSDKLGFPVRRSIDDGRLSTGIGSAIETLGCEFKDGGTVNGVFRGTKFIAVRDESKPVSWDLEFNAALIAPKPTSELSYSTARAKSVMALWDSGKNQLSVGFFGDELRTEDRETVRTNGSFDGSTPHKPDVVISFTVVPGSTSLDLEHLKTFGVAYYRDGAAGFDFPGEEDRFGAFFVKPEKIDTLKNLRGSLAEGSEVSGTFVGELKKSAIGSEVTMKWELSFQTPVYDASLKSDLVPTKPQVPDGAPTAASNWRGVVSADDVDVQMISAAALYYPAAHEISLGVFADRIEQAEIAEMTKRKTVSTYVNLKRPTMAVRLSLDEQGALKSYTLYFYREAGGSFQFPGYHDVASLKRQASDLPAGEIASISGDPSKGPMTIRMKGEGSVAGNPALLKWDLDYRIVPAIVR